MTHPAIPILCCILKPLCELPYDLAEQTSGTSSVITLALEYSDVGKILGRSNRLRDALMVVVESIGQGCGIAARLELDYPKHGEKLPRDRVANDPNFDTQLALDLVGDILDAAECRHVLSFVASGRYLLIDIAAVSEFPKGLIDALDVVMAAWGCALGRSGICVREIVAKA